MSASRYLNVAFAIITTNMYNVILIQCSINRLQCFLEIPLGVLRESKKEQPTVEAEKPKSTNSVVAVGDIAAGVLKRVPLSLAVNLESVEAVAHLDRRAK